MEFIFELIFEIIFEGTLELGSNKKVPMPLRILAFLVFVLIYGFIIVAIWTAGYDVLKDGNVVAAVIFFIVGIGLLIGSIHLFVKKLK